MVRADGGSQVSGRCRQLWDEEKISYTQGAHLKVRMSQHRINADELQGIHEQLSFSVNPTGG